MGNCTSGNNGKKLAEERVRRVLESKMKKEKRKSKTSLPLHAFAAHVQQLHGAEGEDELSRQLERLNAISANWDRVVFTSESGQSPENLLKNRYTNVLPYDNNRVVLAAAAAAGGGDYVNASFVSCCGSSQEFVACQAPLPATLNDHWQMVWQLGATLVVMLASCEEAGRPVCEQYWPSACGAERHFGQLAVAMETEEEGRGWTERRLVLRAGQQRRRVTQLQFSRLPACPAPDQQVGDFCDFLRLADARASATGPTVVHCDSGIGRTGVFLCLHRLAAAADRISSCGEVDVPTAVAAVRLSRNGMVHTTNQLHFLYRCLLHLLLQSGCISDNVDKPGGRCHRHGAEEPAAEVDS